MKFYYKIIFTVQMHRKIHGNELKELAMEKTATDRRTERTKAKILEALLELSKEKSINEISIRELTERAKIHRNTFYIHYTDVYGILDDLENHMCTVAAEATEQFTPQQLRENASDVLEIIFSYLKERREYCMLMLENRTRISVGQKVLESVFEKYLTAFEDSCDRQAFAFQVQFRYCTSGVIGIVLYWIERGCMESPKEMAELTGKLMTKGLEGAILEVTV
ncbi:hypothetical protein HMPREF0490_02679 [Lachnospiraceae bacterium 6_1_37FAA]|nr:hypothetical protein HMPREF0490_02679 [Lachnospiraceae bacterium 6_1_37FAA]